MSLLLDSPHEVWLRGTPDLLGVPIFAKVRDDDNSFPDDLLGFLSPFLSLPNFFSAGFGMLTIPMPSSMTASSDFDALFCHLFFIIIN